MKNITFAVLRTCLIWQKRNLNWMPIHWVFSGASSCISLFGVCSVVMELSCRYFLKKLYIFHFFYPNKVWLEWWRALPNPNFIYRKYWQHFLIDKWRFVVNIHQSNKQRPMFSTFKNIGILQIIVPLTCKKSCK